MGGVSTLGRLHGAGCGRSPVHALAVSLCCQTGALRGVPRRAHAVQPARMYAPPSLLDIAVPDFSMPYNIILFYSTFVALFFGSLLNDMVRRFYDVVV